MSEKIEEITVEGKVTLSLTTEEVATIEGLLADTQYPQEFVANLTNAEGITQERKLIMMYHFAHGHMYSALNSFMQEALPRMMNMSPVEEGLEG